MTSATWFQDAVFYQLPVKSFFDGNGDGVGDFVGLTRKLDYIQELGVDCLWLLPFFPSPLRDDGYDVADYRDIHPSYGTIDDFRHFMKACGERGLRVAAEMAMNHTSDQHPWFQASRSAPEGSTRRDYYVWRDKPDHFREANVHFGDAKRSNWSWDPAARAYYWHRFFDHQPELNYDQLQVREEILRVLRFWRELGVDGLCLNGVSYLVERDGTACEHLPETHAVLREFRQALDASPGFMLQAGVNAWPADTLPYFGEGTECNAAPHLALAQRLFQAVRQEDRHPVVEILRQTPALPQGCQWITLLRNHDELTLALATDEERDYMFREYAADPRMRIHGGIRRRLAPLADNNRRRIELLFGLLFALPGSPMLYYGDEIGMGDNLFLPGRTGVRTPMQWSPDRNAGFSTADAAQLFAPPVADPVYGYSSVNVEAQRRDPSSLLQWVRQLIAVRKQSPAWSRGSLTMLEPANRKVIAFLRQYGDDTYLVVANLARTAQPAELDLSAFQGLLPVEAFGRTAFARIGDRPYSLTLGAHAFFWFRLQKEAEDVSSRLAPVRTEHVAETPTLQVAGGWQAFFNEGTHADDMLETSVLPTFLRSQRWFGGKAREVNRVRIRDHASLAASSTHAFLVLLEVAFQDGVTDTYFVPMAITQGTAGSRLTETHRSWVIARLAGPEGDAVLHDALASDEVCSILIAAAGHGRIFHARDGQIKALATNAFVRLRGDASYPLPVVRGPATSSNSLLFFGRRLLLKVFRRLEVGINPDVEIGKFLTDEHPFDRIPPVAGSFEYQPKDGKGPLTLGILQALVPNQGDGWQHAVNELSRYYDRAWARLAGPDPTLPEVRPLLELSQATPPLGVLETIAIYLQAAETLGRRTAEVHRALADSDHEPAFAPEPLTSADSVAQRDEILAQGRKALASLKDHVDRLSAEVADASSRLLEIGPRMLERFSAASTPPSHATKTRVHGDYHLGQVLWVESDYVILDFEGEPARTVEERRAKFSPLRDVAGMLRSYHYAAYAGLFAYAQNRPADFARLEQWAELWHQWVAAAFLRAYRESARGSSFVPTSDDEFSDLLGSFMLSKAFYELNYELNNRPDWVRIPLRGVLALLEQQAEMPGEMNE
ncbi:MAG: maltose alpha-D-glucosyltransferase [Gemmataceae bacterium]|nr:maltose alpha-D-glucosyltransferase [Gemmataceae bacterium]